MAEAYHHALPAGTRIENFEIRKVLGVGGFGITYKGYDHSLHCDVAIKEYLPNELALRTGDGTTVIPKSDSDKKNYEYGLKRFLDEARTLARFREPNIVRVTRFLESNGTAYLVMDYEDGESLSQYLKRHPTLSEKQIKAVILPILTSLQAVHDKNYLHRDIKPANIYLRKSGSPVLLDFGAARVALGGQTRTITGMVTPGYAPFEQYHTRVRQGPWTDLYALGATMYRCVTGKAPVEATERVAALHENESDPLPPARAVAADRYSEAFLETIDWMLQPNAKDRPQNVQQVIARLTASAPAAADAEVPEAATTTLERTQLLTAEGALTGAGEDELNADDARVAELTRKIAEQGNTTAQFKMGALYARGTGVTKDTEKAVSWCKKAAAQGHASAQFKLAMMYAHGYGIKANAAEALRWCRLAAEQGHAKAQYNLGLMYTFGHGVEPDRAKAAEWFSRAAEQGLEDARVNLGLLQAEPASGRAWLLWLAASGLAAGAAVWWFFR